MSLQFLFVDFSFVSALSRAFVRACSLLWILGVMRVSVYIMVGVVDEHSRDHGDRAVVRLCECEEDCRSHF
jgi:hypothetical protein